MSKKFYVIGTKVSESLSPLIFNYWFKKENIDAEYIFKEIEAKKFNKQIDLILNDQHVFGANITIPYKELIIKKINNIDFHAKKIGAVNFIIKKNNIWSGKNTDWIGFLDPLIKILKEKKDTPTQPLVIGYGGAAKAIIYALRTQGFKKIKVYNRTFNKIKNLDERQNIMPIKNHDIKKHLESSDLIINTVPTDILMNIKNLSLKKNVVGYDIVYKPKETSFLSNFKSKNKAYGINMLLAQAAPCFENLFGFKPKIDKDLCGLLQQEISK